MIPAESIHRLKIFRDLILEWNPHINLSALHTAEEIDEVLIGESVRALSAVSISGKCVLDIGSGAGIPGLVWAMCDSSAKVTSLEVRQKKIAFQKEVLRSTGVDAEVLQGHFPEAVSGRKFDVLVSRGIRFSPRIFEDALQLLDAGGVLVRFSSPGTKGEGWTATEISQRTWLTFHVKHLDDKPGSSNNILR